MASRAQRISRFAAEVLRYTVILVLMSLIMRTHLFFLDKVLDTFYLNRLYLAGPPFVLALSYLVYDLLPSAALAALISLAGRRRWAVAILLLGALFFYANTRCFMLFSTFVDLRAALDNFDWNLAQDLLGWGSENEYLGAVDPGTFTSRVKQDLVFLLYLSPVSLAFIPRRGWLLLPALLLVGAGIYCNWAAEDLNEDLASNPLVELFAQTEIYAGAGLQLRLDPDDFPCLPRGEPLVNYDSSQRYDFVIFLMESVSKTAFDQARLPFMKGLIAEKGVEFLNYYCEKPLSIATFYSLLVGEAYRTGGIEDVEEARAEVLHSREDFALYYIHSGDLSYKNQREILEGNFTLFDMNSSAMSPEFRGSKSRAQDRYLHHVLELNLRRIAQEPFFGLFFVPIMTHTPYYTYDPRLDRRPRVERFFYGLEEQDRVFRSIWDTLDRARLLEHAFVVITSDHGEGLGERDFASGHGLKLYQEHVHIPLAIIPPPGAEIRAKEDDKPLTAFDLNLFIKSLMGSDATGGNLLNSYRRFVPIEALSSAQLYGVVDGRYKLLYHARRREFELYDLQNDRGERHNIYREGDELSEAYAAELFSVYR